MTSINWLEIEPVFSANLHEHPMNLDEFLLAGYRPYQFDAYSRFISRIKTLEAKPVMGAVWRGIGKQFPLICAQGHKCSPYPLNVLAGYGCCRTCARQDPIQAESNFCAKVEALGGVPLYMSWRGVDKPHHVRCANGHDCQPRPSDMQRGKGICLKCAKKDPDQAEEEFLIRIKVLDAVPLYEKWMGALKPHHVRCVNGHDCYPHPSSIQQGQGICQQCFVNHDVLYVITGQDTVKFGITSGDPKPRLRDHKSEGFTEVLRLYTDLPEGIARTAEQQTIAACHDAGFQPVHGREYFDIAALSVILDVIDGHAEAVEAVNQAYPKVTVEWPDTDSVTFTLV